MAKKELDVDFIGGVRSLTKEDEKAISDYLKSRKLTTKKSSLSVQSEITLEKNFTIYNLISVFAANAQRTSIGVTGGVGTAWMSDVVQEVTLNPVWNAGASLVYSTDNHWGIGLDVKYSKEGVRFIYPGTGFYTGQTMATKFANDYIRVPLRGIYFFNTSSSTIRPNVSLGPNIGFLIKSESKSYDGNNDLLTTTDVKSSFNAIDLGVQGTIGVSFKMSDRIWLSTDIAYNQGLLKQNKFGTNNMLNSNLAFNVGLRFGIGN